MPASDIPVARAISRMDAPAYPFSQKTSVACSRIFPSCCSKRALLTAASLFKRGLERARSWAAIIRSNVRSNHNSEPRLGAKARFLFGPVAFDQQDTFD